MPKKFQGENSKSAQARARKDAKRQEDKERAQKAAEDAYWQDDDKHVKKKQQRKEDKERKHREQLDRKQEAAKLLEEEMAAIKVSAKAKPEKVTRADIETRKQKEEAQAKKAKAVKDISYDEIPLEENVNRMVVDGDEARNVDEALSLLSNKEDLDKHPEKRVKAAYKAFEEKNLPRLKEEYSNMRLSQLKQMLKKEWMKSPENPMNQKTLAYNEKK